MFHQSGLYDKQQSDYMRTTYITDIINRETLARIRSFRRNDNLGIYYSSEIKLSLPQLSFLFSIFYKFGILIATIVFVFEISKNIEKFKLKFNNLRKVFYSS